MHSQFDVNRLTCLPITKRKSDLDLTAIIPLRPADRIPRRMQAAAQHIVKAKNRGAPIIMMIGAHVIRRGVQRYIIDLMKNGYISVLSMNGACVIHDYEFALTGCTTESVSEYIRNGHFGFWNETGIINDIVSNAAKENFGLGEAIGKYISLEDFPNKDASLFAAGYELGILLTVHVGIGYDITHQHPNCDGAAYGKTSYLDFLRFASVLEKLEYGVVMVFGSAVMAPEVFLKALSMARNAARQTRKEIKEFTTLVCDLQPLPEDFHIEPDRNNPQYFFRPWKTLLVRTVQDGGNSYYMQGDHRDTIPALWTAIKEAES